MNAMIIPKLRGKLKIDCTITALSEEFATSIFKLASVRLLLVKKWNELTDSLLSTVQVLDEYGNEIDREIRDGDYFKINTPVGYDWVKVERVEVNKESTTQESLILEVRRVSDPFQVEGIVEFEERQESESSILIVSRKGMNITAAVYAKDEAHPDAGGLSISDKAMNKMKPILGGLRIQWRSLVNGILGNLEELETYSF